MSDDLEVLLVQQVGHVVLAASEEVVKADDLRMRVSPGKVRQTEPAVTPNHLPACFPVPPFKLTWSPLATR